MIKFLLKINFISFHLIIVIISVWFFHQSRQFVCEKLGPRFGAVIRSANELRNSVSQEAKLFNSVCLAALDRRIVDG